MILLSHATGNENVRQAALAFVEAELLGEFWTCLNWNEQSRLNRFLPDRWRSRVRRRSFQRELTPFVRTRPLLESVRLLTGMVNIDRVLRDLDWRVSRRLPQLGQCDLVYAYEDEALATFRKARELGVPRVYDLPIGYWKVAQEIYAEEAEREPTWAPTLTGRADDPEKLARKEEELALAQHVVVASSFTKHTLKAANIDTVISVIPYGAPAISAGEIAVERGQLRVLFVGSLGQRKGLSYLLQAVDSLGSRVQLTLLGRKTAVGCKPLETATRKHRWIPSLPHADVLRVMREHDVLVLPSLFEGFGLVILEAMAQGLPVIATPHTAGPDLIEDNADGFIVPIRSTSAIVEKLEALLADRAHLREMKMAARMKAQRCRWEDYRSALADMAREVVRKKEIHATRR